MGKVRLRFAPEPSGYLHIGHLKAALLNQDSAQKYHGKQIIHFDDTNPAKKNNEFVYNILNDLETMGINYELIFSSDYFPQLIGIAQKFIEEEKSFIHDSPREQMQSEHRGLQCCLKGKVDMQHPNKSLRDPVYYRCNPIPHQRIGPKYKIYPKYDLSCAFVDSIQGITHALQSSEYHDRNAQYFRIQETMGLRKVHIYEFSRLNIVYTPLSKQKLLWFVENEMVDGWDDAHFPTVQGMGPSKNLNLMEWDKLWSINKKIIDPVVLDTLQLLKKVFEYGALFQLVLLLLLNLISSILQERLGEWEVYSCYTSRKDSGTPEKFRLGIREGDFHHWLDLFNHFDTYFEKYIKPKKYLQLEDDFLEHVPPFPREVVSQILRVVQIIIEYCTNSHFYSSYELKELEQMSLPTDANERKMIRKATRL
ncbi:glutamate--tRNA ligase, cytoplasmic [Tanacetum coccineum]|uniref:Glutamate--tRNA ligase, cytoplasmic n=1 Tax=Tanacetum coccineum TaxID=301880 RepID=A0ABQ5FYC4_9ASTR